MTSKKEEDGKGGLNSVMSMHPDSTSRGMTRAWERKELRCLLVITSDLLYV